MKFVINQKFIQEIEKKNNRGLVEAANFIENKLRLAVPSDTNTLRNSIDTTFVNKDTARIGSNTIQAAIMEQGRKPGRMPNFDALAGWTVRRFGLPGRKTGGYEEQPSETQSIIYLVARKIGTKGIKARHLFSKVRDIYGKKAEQIYFYYMKQ